MPSRAWGFLFFSLTLLFPSKIIYYTQALFSILAFSFLLDCQACINLLSAGNIYFLHGTPAEEADKTERIMQEPAN